jgi:hypothetical protein
VQDYIITAASVINVAMAPTIITCSLQPKIMPFAGDEIDGQSAVDGRNGDNMTGNRQLLAVETKRYLDQLKRADKDRHKRPRVSRKHRKVGCLCLPGELTVCLPSLSIVG